MRKPEADKTSRKIDLQTALPRRPLFAPINQPQTTVKKVTRAEVAKKLAIAAEAQRSARRRGEAKGKPYNLRLQPDLVAKVEARAKRDEVSAVEAIRRMVEEA